MITLSWCPPLWEEVVLVTSMVLPVTWGLTMDPGHPRSWNIFLNYFWTILLNFTPSKVSSSCLGSSLSSTRGSHTSHVTSPAGQETGDRGEYLLGGGNSFIVSLMNKEYLKFWKVKEYIQNNFRIENVWVVSIFHFDSVRGSWYLTF